MRTPQSRVKWRSFERDWGLARESLFEGSPDKKRRSRERCQGPICKPTLKTYCRQRERSIIPYTMFHPGVICKSLTTLYLRVSRKCLVFRESVRLSHQKYHGRLLLPQKRGNVCVVRDDMVCKIEVFEVSDLRALPRSLRMKVKSFPFRLRIFPLH